MTYPDDVLKAAREAAAEVRFADYPSVQADIRDGKLDAYVEVRLACIAIMAERQRCAGIARATVAYDDALARSSGFGTTGERIARAILGQQEKEP